MYKFPDHFPEEAMSRTRPAEVQIMDDFPELVLQTCQARMEHPQKTTLSDSAFLFLRFAMFCFFSLESPGL